MPAATLEINKVNATGSHASSTNETTLFTFTPTLTAIDHGIWLDLVNLTQNCTIRVNFQIDGTNARTFQTIAWTTGMDDGVLIEGDIPVDDSLAVSIQSAVAEGASRNIPYRHFYTSLGAGAIAFEYTLTDVASQPIANAKIWFTTDLSGVNIVASGTSDSNGQVIAYLTAGTIYVWRQRAGYDFQNPDTEVVAA